MTCTTLSHKSSILPREMQCAYRSKLCDAPRATKLDGTLHKLCDFHRHKANANQQRLHKRKKRILEAQVDVSLIPHTPKTEEHTIKRLCSSPDSPQSTTEPIDGLTFHSNFNVLEVRILEVLLFGADGMTTRRPSQTTFNESDACCSDSTMLASMVTAVPEFHDTWSVTL